MKYTGNNDTEQDKINVNLASYQIQDNNNSRINIIKYHFGIHPLFKLFFYIIFNFFVFTPIYKTPINGLLLILIEIIIAAVVKIDLRLFIGFLKFLLLNFIGLFFLFYLAYWDLNLVLLEFGLYLITIFSLSLASFIFIASTPTYELIISLRKLKIPSELVFAISFLSQFLPIISKRIHEIIIFQKARGYKIRIWRLGPIIIPAILDILNFSTNLSISLKSRGFLL